MALGGGEGDPGMYRKRYEVGWDGMVTVKRTEDNPCTIPRVFRPDVQRIEKIMA